MRKNKTLEEKIQEELKYSEYLNKKINQISKKNKEKKQKIKKVQNNFDYINEFNYLKEQQKKIENELMLSLYDYNNKYKEKESENILQQFYYTITLEKDLSIDFNSILALIKNKLNEIKEEKIKNNNKPININKEGLNKLFETLKYFDKNLISLSQDDYNFLDLNENDINNNDKNNESEIESENSNLNISEINNNNINIIDLLFYNDTLNNFRIFDIDYIVNQEMFQSEKNKKLIFLHKHKNFSLSNKTKKKIYEKYFSFPLLNYIIPINIQEKIFMTLGENQGNESITNIEKSFQLMNMKYKNDYERIKKELFNQLNQIDNKHINLDIKIKCGNIHYFIKNFNNKESLTKILSNVNINQKNVILQYENQFNFLEYLFKYRKNIKFMINKYYDEYNELKVNSNKAINEELITETNNLKDKIDKYDFNVRKEVMNNIHKKNKEVYEIKQKFKKEREEMDRKLKLKMEQEKNEKLRKQNLINKKHVEEYQQLKKEKELIEQEILRKKKEYEDKKLRLEIESKLPIIQQNNIISVNKFINNQRHKEYVRQQQEINEQRLNYIIENYKSRPKVQSDPERLISITKVLQNRYEAQLNNIPDQDEKAKMFTNNGFTVEHLMKDFRYRVSSCLYEAGILDHDAAKDYMRQLNTMIANNNNNNSNL
jgi:hypothetical protein